MAVQLVQTIATIRNYAIKRMPPDPEPNKLVVLAVMMKHATGRGDLAAVMRTTVTQRPVQRG